LTSSEVFVLDAIASLFVWVGKNTALEEKKEGMNLAQRFMEQTGRPAHTPIIRITEGAETAPFKVSQSLYSGGS